MANAVQPQDGLASGPHVEAVGLVDKAFGAGGPGWPGTEIKRWGWRRAWG